MYEMNGGVPEKAAARSDWQTQDMPAQQARYFLKKKLTSEQLETLKRGHVPQAMEDKWFWFYEDDRLYIHRSWTGICIYILRFYIEEGKILVISNRDPRQYKCMDNQEDAAQLSWLLDSCSNPDRDYRQEWMAETLLTIQKAKAQEAAGNSAETPKKQNNIPAE